jgi:hypothetical protein
VLHIFFPGDLASKVSNGENVNLVKKWLMTDPLCWDLSRYGMEENLRVMEEDGEDCFWGVRAEDLVREGTCG